MLDEFSINAYLYFCACVLISMPYTIHKARNLLKAIKFSCNLEKFQKIMS